MRQDGWPHQGLEGPHAKSTSFLHRDLSHGKMRHDLIVPRDRCGALIGPGGSVFKDMSARIGAGVHIFDRDLVPGEPEERRLVVVTGSPQQCMLAAAEVMLITSRPNDPNKVFTSGPLAGHRVQDQRPGQASRLGLRGERCKISCNIATRKRPRATHRNIQATPLPERARDRGGHEAGFA